MVGVHHAWGLSADKSIMYFHYTYPRCILLTTFNNYLKFLCTLASILSTTRSSWSDVDSSLTSVNSHPQTETDFPSINPLFPSLVNHLMNCRISHAYSTLIQRSHFFAPSGIQTRPNSPAVLAVMNPSIWLMLYSLTVLDIRLSELLSEPWSQPHTKSRFFKLQASTFQHLLWH